MIIIDSLKDKYKIVSLIIYVETMDFKKILGDYSQYFGAGFFLRDYPALAVILIIVLALINKGVVSDLNSKMFTYLMRNHKQIKSKETTDKNGTTTKIEYFPPK